MRTPVIRPIHPYVLVTQKKNVLHNAIDLCSFWSRSKRNICPKASYGMRSISPGPLINANATILTLFLFYLSRSSTFSPSAHRQSFILILHSFSRSTHLDSHHPISSSPAAFRLHSTRTHIHTLAHAHTHTLTLTLSHSTLTLTRTHTHTITQTHTHIHTHTHLISNQDVIDLVDSRPSVCESL